MTNLPKSAQTNAGGDVAVKHIQPRQTIIEIAGIPKYATAVKANISLTWIKAADLADVLAKQGGTLHASVPIPPGQGWAGDPTHADPPWTLPMFDRFCSHWGGNEPGHEATESSGINFGFELVQQFQEPLGEALTVILKKPRL